MMLNKQLDEYKSNEEKLLGALQGEKEQRAKEELEFDRVA